MLSKYKSIMYFIVFMMMIIITILDKSQALEKSDISYTFQPPGACYGDDSCTNKLSTYCYDKIATYICCEEDYRIVDLKNCTQEFECSFPTEECFNDLIVADLLNQNPCNNTDIDLIKDVAHDAWGYFFNLTHII